MSGNNYVVCNSIWKGLVVFMCIPSTRMSLVVKLKYPVFTCNLEQFK